MAKFVSCPSYFTVFLFNIILKIKHSDYMKKFYLLYIHGISIEKKIPCVGSLEGKESFILGSSTRGLGD